MSGEGGGVMQAWSGAKYIPNGTQIGCEIYSGVFIGGFAKFRAKVEDSKLFLRIFRNDSKMNRWDFDTGWINRAEVVYFEYTLSAWKGYLLAEINLADEFEDVSCTADWP
mgnify:FL=1